MASTWYKKTAPSAVATPGAGYVAIFNSDGTEGTTVDSWYGKLSNGSVVALTFSTEQAQDAVGSILTDSATIDFTYDDVGNTITAIVALGSITIAHLSFDPATQVELDAHTGLTTSAHGGLVPSSRTISTTAPLTGGGDLSSNRTLAINVATTSVKGAQSPSDKLKEDNIWKDAVADGGLNNTGASDNTALLQALHDSLPSTGGTIFFPIGVYRFDGTVNITKSSVYLLGQARRETKICTSHATADIFNISGDACLVEGIRFSTIVAGTPDNTTLRTGGFACTFTSSSDSAGMRKCDILFQHSGIQSSGSLHFFDDLNIREYGNNAPNGQCILINGTGDRYITRLTTDNGSDPTGFAGIRVTQCASLVISDSNIINATTCLALEPGNGLTVPSVEVVNTFFDSSDWGMRISPVGTGSVFRCKFTGCWFGTNTSGGVQMNGTQWDGITFDNCEFYNTGQTGIGISCPTGGGKWTVCNSRIAGYATGISLTASAQHFPTIVNNVIGPTAGFSFNTTGILVAAGTYRGLIVSNNTVVSNTTNLTLGAVAVAVGEGSFFRITDNSGINPRGAVTIPGVPAAGATVTNTTGFRVLIIWKVGTANTSITINGVLYTVATVAAAVMSVYLEPGGTFAFAGGTMTSWTWIGQ